MQTNAPNPRTDPQSRLPMGRGRTIAASYAGILLSTSLLFLGAGTFRFSQGILYVILALIGTALSHLLEPRNSDITIQRASKAQDGQPWDKKILGIYFLLSLALFVTAGLDSGRYGGSGPRSPFWTVIGIALMLAGQILFALARRENHFFTSTVNIQSERNHRVCETGPYRLIRHPGYLGLLLSLLASPLILQSGWAFIPASAATLLLGVRTRLEDRFLTQYLPGYADYATRTRWRLIPGLF